MNAYCNLYLINSSFDNCSSIFGGAYLQLSGKLEIENSNFTDNRAEYNGGAIYISDVDASIRNSTFSNNHVGIYEGYPTCGGAVFSDFSNLTITSNNFTNNSAFEGSAIYSYESEYHLDNLELNDNYEDAIFTYFDTEGSKIGSYSGKDVLNKSAINNTDYPNVVDTVGMQIVLINQTNITDLPVVYDLREEHLVTPVRDQGYMGSCWAFGMTATLELAVLKSLGIETDFSENNMQNSMLLYSKYGNKGINEGGENIIGVGYLLSWIGSFTMDYDTYDELGKISPFITSCDDLHIQDIIFIPNTPGDETSIKTVKNAILKYGALYAVLNSKASSEDGESNYYNPDTFAQYNPNLNLSNHAICVVGWDDTFSKDNFGIAPPGDGAWIIKNSWGEDWEIQDTSMFLTMTRHYAHFRMLLQKGLLE